MSWVIEQRVFPLLDAELPVFCAQQSDEAVSEAQLCATQLEIHLKGEIYAYEMAKSA